MTDSEKLDEFFSRVASWERLGKRTFSDSVVFYALPRDENDAETGHLWLHRLFPALTEAEIADMERAFDITLPEVFKQFYLRANGANLFGRTLALYGWMSERMSDLAVGLGLYNIRELQSMYRPWDASPSHFFFGTVFRYSNNTNYLYVDREDDRVYLTKHKYTAEPMATWDSLPDMLLSEYERLEGTFTRNGLRIEELPQFDEAILKEGEALWVKAMKERRAQEREKGAKKRSSKAQQ